MDAEQMKTWHEKRESLFAVKLPHSAISHINAQLPLLDHERAMAALVVYRAEKPYKGFYMARFNWHYQRTPSARTDRAASRAAAEPADAFTMEDALDSERREREAYDALPFDFLEQCREQFAGWGWPEGTRGWRILCLDAYVGRPVEQYRQRANIFSKEYEREERIQAQEKWRAERGYLDLIAALRAEVVRLGGRCDIVA